MDGGRPWRGFLSALAAAAAAVFALLFGLVVAADPYDTGRFALLRGTGVPAQSPRTAHASRGRDPLFDAAIIGNSHAQLLSPAELTAATRFRFVSLTVPATGPREQLVLIDYFLRHRVRPPRALVIGLDPIWCRPDPAMPVLMPFPFWLYDPSPWRYLAGLVRERSLGDAFRRIAQALRLSPGRPANRDGYWDYDAGVVWTAARQGALLSRPSPTTVPNETGPFPALDALARRLDRAAPDLRVVLVRPPVAAAALPPTGSELDRSETSCRQATKTLLQGRPGLSLVDWRGDRPEAHVPENFIDPTHYRTRLARAVETDIARALLTQIRRGLAPPE